MKKKIIIALSILAVLGLGVLAYKKYSPAKPCGCNGNSNNSAMDAINKMTEAELKDQIIKKGSKIRLDNKTIDELRAILVELTTNH